MRKLRTLDEGCANSGRTPAAEPQPPADVDRAARGRAGRRRDRHSRDAQPRRGGRAGVRARRQSPTRCAGRGPARRSCRSGAEAGMQDRWLEWLRGAPPGSVDPPLRGRGPRADRQATARCCSSSGWCRSRRTTRCCSRCWTSTRRIELAREIGIESPLTFNVHTQDDIAIALERISYPCALKPVHSHEFARHFAGMKAFGVHNDEDMRAALSRTVAFGIEMIATEIIPGADDQFFSYYSYIDEEGEPLLHATKRKLRQYPIWFGSGCFHATDWNPEVGGAGPAVLRGRGPARARQRRVQAGRARRPPEADRVQPPLHGRHRPDAGGGPGPAAVRLQPADRPPAAAGGPATARARRCGIRCATCVPSSPTAATARSRCCPGCAASCDVTTTRSRACRTRAPCWRTTCACSAASGVR